MLIIGNDFDGSCGYKTKYVDFLKTGYCNDSKLFSCFQNSDDLDVIDSDEWNGFEKLICQYLSFIRHLFTSNKIKRNFIDNNFLGFTGYEFSIDERLEDDIDAYKSFMSIAVSLGRILTLQLNDGTKIIDYIVFRTLLDNRNIFPLKFVYFDTFKDFDKKDEIVEKRIIKKIEEELNKLEIGLQNYIKEETSKESHISSFLQDLISKCEFNQLLSFNYSYVAEKILNIEKNKSFYIHGDIDGSIILGIEDNMLSNQTINNESNYAVFFKRYRRILKDTITGLDNRILAFINDKSIIGIYGHSLDLSDKSIFTRIFNSKAARFDIYCYEDINIYKERVNRLIGLDLFEELCSADRIKFIPIPKEKIE